MLPNNRSLPILPMWQARSFWVQLLLALTVMLNAQGVDLMGALGSLGLGTTPEDVVETGARTVSAVQQLAPIGLGLWAWIERRAPNFRLSLWGR